MMDFSLITELTEEQKDLFRLADIVSFGIIAVVLLAVILWIVYFVRSSKQNGYAKRSGCIEDSYIETEGIITGIRKVTYSVVPYRRKKLYPEDLDADKLFGKKKAEQIRREREKYQKEYLSPSEENPEPIEKVRYDVSYEFNIKDDDFVYSGEFSVYSESDEISDGKSIAVMYNPTKPEANYTKYNSPIGR